MEERRVQLAAQTALKSPVHDASASGEGCARLSHFITQKILKTCKISMIEM